LRLATALPERGWGSPSSFTSSASSEEASTKRAKMASGLVNHGLDIKAFHSNTLIPGRESGLQAAETVTTFV
jgi:hypothetical protein